MSGQTVAVAAGANNGTSPPTPTLGGGSRDTNGSISFGSGSSPAAGAQVVLTSGAGWSGVGITPAGGLGTLLQPLNAATAALGPWYCGWDSAGRVLTISSTNAPAASQTATTYSLSYAVIG